MKFVCLSILLLSSSLSLAHTIGDIVLVFCLFDYRKAELVEEDGKRYYVQFLNQNNLNYCASKGLLKELKSAVIEYHPVTEYDQFKLGDRVTYLNHPAQIIDLTREGRAKLEFENMNRTPDYGYLKISKLKKIQD